MRLFFLLSLLIIHPLVVAAISNIQVKADEIVYNNEKKTLFLKKNIIIKSPEFMIIGSSSHIKMNEEKIEIEGMQAEFKIFQDNLEGKANKIILFPQVKVEMIGNAHLITSEGEMKSERIDYILNSGP